MIIQHNVHRGGPTESYHQDKMSECTDTIPALPVICFSSSTEHALHNAQSLFPDLSDMMEDCRDLVYLPDDGWKGWIVGPNKKLLLHIPFSHPLSFHYTPWTRLVIPRGIPELDLSRMAHGSDWYKCYSPIQF